MQTKISYKQIWAISFPIILGSIAQNIITVTDTAFLGRVSEVALGAVALSGLLYIVFTMLAWGFSCGLQIVVARRYGEGNISKIGATVEHALYFIIPLSIVLFLSLRLSSDSLLGYLLKSDNVAQASSKYLNIRSWGIFISCINYVFRGFYVGIAKTRVIGSTTICMAIVNVILDYIFIFGKMGVPAMGIEGAALASFIAEICALVYFVIYSFTKLPYKEYELFKFAKINWDLMKRLISVSIPTMIQNFLSLGCWFLFFIFVENLGERPLASSNIVRSLYMLINIPIFAFGASANTLTSQLIGSKRSDEIMPMLWRVAKLSTVLVLTFTLLIVILPTYALSIYTDNQELINYSVSSIYVISIASIFFGFGMTFFQAISGTGRTMHALKIESFVLVLYMTYVCYFTIYLKSDIAVVWTSETVYAVLLGLTSYLYMRSGKWKGAIA
jgi:putative MATE family efflux protein